MRLLTGTAAVEIPDDAVADLDAVGERFDCTLQAFDARSVADAEHLRRAVELADRERGRGEGIARDRGVEILLYAAGRRQIDRALAMGIDAGETPAVVLASSDPADDAVATDDPVPVHDGTDLSTTDGTDADAPATERERAALGAVADFSWFAPDTVALGDPGRLRSFFEIGERETAATDASLADLVRERTALLVVDR